LGTAELDELVLVEVVLVGAAAAIVESSIELIRLPR